MSRAGFLIAGTMTRLKSDRCSDRAKGTCWTRETFGGSERPGRRHQEWRNRTAVVLFGEDWRADLPIVPIRSLGARAGSALVVRCWSLHVRSRARQALHRRAPRKRRRASGSTVLRLLWAEPGRFARAGRRR